MKTIMKTIKILSALSIIFLITSCNAYKEVANFPPANEVFVTSGDGDIQKPYTPVGQLIYMKAGARIPLPLLGMIPINDVDPDTVLREEVFTEIRKRGGDGLINMQITFQAPKSGIIGLGASGGHIFVTGTIIKR